MLLFDTLLHDFWMSKKIVTDQISYLNELSSSFHVMASSCIKSNKAHEHPPHKLDNFPLPHYIDIINPLITQFSNMAQKIASQAREAETQRKFLADLVRPAVKNYDQLKNQLGKALKSKQVGDQVQVAKNAIEKFEEQSQTTVNNALGKMKWLSQNIAEEISQILELGVMNQYVQFNEENTKFRRILKGDSKLDQESTSDPEKSVISEDKEINSVVKPKEEIVDVAQPVEVIQTVVQSPAEIIQNDTPNENAYDENADEYYNKIFLDNLKD